MNDFFYFLTRLVSTILRLGSNIAIFICIKMWQRQGSLYCKSKIVFREILYIIDTKIENDQSIF